MPIIEITNFAAGIQSSSGYTRAKDVAAEEMRNLIIDRQGRLARRNGSTRPLVTTELGGLINCVWRVVYDHGGSTTARRHILISAISGGFFVGRWNGSTAWSGVNSLQYSYSSDEMFVEGILFQGRFFYGRGNLTTGATWLDIQSATPVSYQLGQAAPTAATLAVNANGNNDLTASLYYGVTYTYYNSTYEIETAPATRATIQTTAGNRTIRATLVRPGVSTQWNRMRVWRTAGYDSADAASAAVVQLVGTYTQANTAGSDNVDISGTDWDAPVGTGFAAYTIGAVNTTTDHTPLTPQTSFQTAWQFVEAWGSRLWIAQSPRTIRYCKLTSDGAFPDWWPADNTFDVGEDDEMITGLKAVPAVAALLVFTNRHVYVVRGNSKENIDVSVRLDYMGCAYPRTVVSMGSTIYYVGSDSQIWVTDGQTARAISTPVNNFLTYLNLDLKWVPCATRYRDEYWLAFPSGALTTSSSSTTVVTPGAQSFWGAVQSQQETTDASAWNLANAKIGHFVFGSTLPASLYLDRHNAVVTAVNDGTDTITTEASFPVSLATGVTYSVVRNDRILIYNTTLRNWRMQDSPSVRAFSWFESRTDDGQLFAALDSGAFLDWIDNDNATTDTGGTAITSLWKSNWFTLPRKAIIRGVYVFQATGSSLTIDIYVDQSTTATQTVTGFTPSASNLYRAGVFAYGRQVQVQIQGSAMNPIDRIWIEWEPY